MAQNLLYTSFIWLDTRAPTRPYSMDADSKWVKMAVEAYCRASYTERRAIQHYFKGWSFRSIRKRFKNDFGRTSEVRALCLPFRMVRTRVTVPKLESLAESDTAALITAAFEQK